MFLKSNLEYEQRLKEHLYQFEDQDQPLNEVEGDDTNLSEANSRGRTYQSSPDDDKKQKTQNQN